MENITTNNNAHNNVTATAINNNYHKHHHHSKSNPISKVTNSVTNAAKENPMVTGIVIGAGVSIPVTAFVTSQLQKHAWLKAAAEFDAAVTSGAAKV